MYIYTVFTTKGFFEVAIGTWELPRELENKENRPEVTYKLTNAIKNKILNYKDTVNSIYAEDEISFDPCECEHSPFIDPHHKHIITGDIRIVGNSKLLTKGPNYREPRSTNYNKAFAEITTGLDNYIENLASKTKCNVNNFHQWKKVILEKINLKIEKLKTKIKPSFTKPILSDADVLAYLETLHRKYVLVPIDKARMTLRLFAKNFIFVKFFLKWGSITTSNQFHIFKSKLF